MEKHRWFWRVLLPCVDSQRIGRRADFGASGGFSEVGRLF